MTPEHWQQVKEVFQATLDVEPERRSKYLSEACAGNPTLLREVEALLASNDSAGDFIEAPALGPRPAASDDTPTAGLGWRIGPYEVVELIGEGGMGAVYRAVRADDEYQKQVAIKLVKRGMDTDFILRRFRTERQILARLDHPNIARLLDGGVTHDGRPYFVMEYLTGTPIHQYGEAHKLPVAERLRLFLEVCGAVHYAHQNLVVHRDIKPTNILVTAEGVPKLLDFGIAKLLDRDDGLPLTSSTSPMMRLMTPDYASPEQIRGEVITTATDVYSLGVSLYEMLTGRRPYQFAGKYPDEIGRILAEIEPPRPDAGGDLDNIVFKAMHKDAQQRYASVQQFAEDIRRYLEGRPVIARADTLLYRAGKFVRRHRAGVAMAAVMGLMLVAGVALSTWQAGVAQAERSAGRQRFYDLRDLTNSFLMELDNALTPLPGSTPARELLVNRAVQYLDRLARSGSSDPSLQRELATAYEKLGDVQGGPKASNLGDSTGALASYRKSLAILEKLEQTESSNTQLRRDLARNYEKLSNVMAVTGDHKGSLAYDQKALEIRQALLAADPNSLELRRDVASSFHELSGDLSRLGDWAAVLDYRRKAYSMLKELYALDSSDPATRRAFALAAKRLGRILVRNGDVAAALRHYQEALAIETADLKRSPGDAASEMNLSFTHHDVGAAHFVSGNYPTALQNYRMALQIRQALAAADPKDARTASGLSTSYLRIGLTLLKMSDTAGAVENFRRSLAIREGLVTIDPKNAGARGEVAEACAALGDAFKQMNRSGEARDWYERALTIFSDLKSSGKLTAAFAAEPERLACELKGCATSAKPALNQ